MKTLCAIAQLIGLWLLIALGLATAVAALSRLDALQIEQPIHARSSI